MRQGKLSADQGRNGEEIHTGRFPDHDQREQTQIGGNEIAAEAVSAIAAGKLHAKSFVA